MRNKTSFISIKTIIKNNKFSRSIDNDDNMIKQRGHDKTKRT